MGRAYGWTHHQARPRWTFVHGLGGLEAHLPTELHANHLTAAFLQPCCLEPSRKVADASAE